MEKESGLEMLEKLRKKTWENFEEIKKELEKMIVDIQLIKEDYKKEKMGRD